MTCHDFQRKWDELLDAEAGVLDVPGATRSRPTGLDGDLSEDEAVSLLLAHAADCPTCRPVAVRYQTLRHAIRAWRQPPVPPADLVQRVLATPAERSPQIWRIPATRARRLWQDRGSRYRLLLAGFAASAMVGFIVCKAFDWKSRRDRHDW